MQVHILLVEDNPGDADLVVEALKAEGVGHRLSVVVDGIEALSFLRRTGRYEGEEATQLVILDLNLPRMDGREVLAEIKRDPRLRHLPIVVLTSSGAERDLVQCYELQASSYVIKPVELEQFLSAVRAIRSFWLEVARLPPAGAATSEHDEA